MGTARDTILLMPCMSYTGEFGSIFPQLGLFALRAHALQFPELSGRFDFPVLPWPAVGEWTRVWDPESVYTDLVSNILKHRPRVVAFSLYVYTIGPAHRLARILKQVAPDILVVVGGPEIADREPFMQHNPAFDVVVEGEGEGPFREFLTRLKDGRDDLTGIGNLSFRRADGTVVHNPPDCVGENPDHLRNVFAPHVDQVQGTAFYIKERGCPNRCTYCGWAQQRRSSKPLALVADELDTLLGTRRIRRLMLLDSDILAIARREPDTYEAIRSTLERHGRPDTTICTTPAGVAHPFLEKVAHELNASEVFVGVQSMNPDTLRAVGRGWQVKQLPNLAQAPAHMRRQIIPQFMVPLPEETPRTFYEGLYRIIELGYLRFHVFPTMVTPGTQLRREAEAYGVKYFPDPPYLCFQTRTFPAPEALEAAVVGSILSEMVSKAGTDVDVAWERFERMHREHPDLIGWVRQTYRTSASVRQCREAIVAELLADRAPEPAAPPAAVARQAFPPEDAFRACVARYGMAWTREEIVEGRLEATLTGPEGEAAVLLFPASSPNPCFAQAGGFKVAYRGRLAQMDLLKDVLALCAASAPDGTAGASHSP